MDLEWGRKKRTALGLWLSNLFTGVSNSAAAMNCLWGLDVPTWWGVAVGSPPSLAVGPEVTLGAVGKYKATVVHPRGLGAHSSRRSAVTVMAQGREPQPTSHPRLAACLHRRDPRVGNEGIPGGDLCAHGRTEGTTW